jgi:hypothetical protein
MSSPPSAEPARLHVALLLSQMQTCEVVVDNERECENVIIVLFFFSMLRGEATGIDVMMCEVGVLTPGKSCPGQLNDGVGNVAHWLCVKEFLMVNATLDYRPVRATLYPKIGCTNAACENIFSVVKPSSPSYDNKAAEVGIRPSNNLSSIHIVFLVVDTP